MIKLLDYIQRRLSLRLGLLILIVVTVMFSLVFNVLFYYSKEYVRQVAIDRANQLLDNTVVKISGVMEETELVTNSCCFTREGFIKLGYDESYGPGSRFVVSLPVNKLIK